MANRSIYFADDDLWASARRLAGSVGISAVIADLVRQWVADKLKEEQAKPKETEMTETPLWVGGSVANDGDLGDHHVAFTGRMVADSADYSLAQIPRVRVFQTRAGKLLVHRDWTSTPINEGAMYTIFDSFEALEQDALALQMDWVDASESGDDPGVRTAPPQFMRDLARSLGKPVIVRID